MLDKDNIISTSVSETVEKDNRKCSFMRFTLHCHIKQRADRPIANRRNSSCLHTRIHPVYLKNHRRHFT